MHVTAETAVAERNCSAVAVMEVVYRHACDVEDGSVRAADRDESVGVAGPAEYRHAVAAEDGDLRETRCGGLREAERGAVEGRFPRLQAQRDVVGDHREQADRRIVGVDGADLRPGAEVDGHRGRGDGQPPGAGVEPQPGHEFGSREGDFEGRFDAGLVQGFLRRGPGGAGVAVGGGERGPAEVGDVGAPAREGAVGFGEQGVQGRAGTGAQGRFRVDLGVRRHVEGAGERAPLLGRQRERGCAPDPVGPVDTGRAAREFLTEIPFRHGGARGGGRQHDAMADLDGDRVDWVAVVLDRDLADAELVAHRPVLGLGRGDPDPRGRARRQRDR